MVLKESGPWYVRIDLLNMMNPVWH
jgi:hypothetical protein